MIIPMTKLYLRIIFSGLIFTFMYNCFASTLRALGDSKSPLYFLIISSVVNVFGDLIFVLIFHMGSEPSAISDDCLRMGFCDAASNHTALISSFVNMSVRVIFAAVLVFHFSLQIEALPFSYLAGWIGMLLAEVPLLLRKF